MAPLARLPGLESYDVGAFGGDMMPAATPRPIVERLATEMAAALATTGIRDRLANIGFQAIPGDAANFTAYLRRHREEFRQVIEVNNIRAGG